jgi:hypothetical protein
MLRLIITAKKRSLMPASTIRYQTFPQTSAPPAFVESIISVMRRHEQDISTLSLRKGLTSDEFLRVIRDDLVTLGFNVEAGKNASSKISRPVLFGENGESIVNYEIDAYHAEWQLVLEVEAGRAWMGNAVYRDLIRACPMVGVKFLALAVPNSYKYSTSGRPTISKDYDNTKHLIETLYG